MAKAVICPICHGKGKIKREDVSTTDDNKWKVCHGCGGRGWVEVSEW